MPSGEGLAGLEKRIELDRLLAREDYRRAVELWQGLEPFDELDHLTKGYLLFEGLMATRQEALAHEVLDEAIERGLRHLRDDSATEPPSPDLYNAVAWACAMRGRHLATARALADVAIQEVEGRLRRWPWGWIVPADALRQRLGMYLNTRGWIEFRQWGETRTGDPALALRDLQRAAELLPIGANYLYLAWAYYGLSELRDAREAARRARSAEDLTPYEELLLEELEEDLGGA
jgi:tetratricopeptide (TPR) repeat protein